MIEKVPLKDAEARKLTVETPHVHEIAGGTVDVEEAKTGATNGGADSGASETDDDASSEFEYGSSEDDEVNIDDSKNGSVKVVSEVAEAEATSP
ncbi:hypothetical protein U1Q18_032738 [Sarracenia purpurea var. burkii]